MRAREPLGHKVGHLLTYMYRQAFTFLDFGYGSALAFMLTGLVLVLSLLQLRIFGRSAPKARTWS